MLQFITKTAGPNSVRRQVEGALDGGCRWIELAPCDELKKIAEDLMPVLRETEAFLVIRDDVELVEELRVHGVHLSHADRERAKEVREKLGAHAVVGVDCVTAADAIALKGTDMDYVAFHVEPTPEAIAAFAQTAKEVKDAGTGVHVVARGEFPPEMLAQVIAAGAAGVAVSSEIADAEDPAGATAKILDALEAALLSR